jgi:hypothetical protein
MKLNELVESIAKKADKQFDWGFKEMLRVDIVSARASALKREYEKSKLIPKHLVQTIECIMLEQHKGCVDCDGDIVYRTKCKIPKPIMLRNDMYYIRVTTPIRGTKSVSIPIMGEDEIEDLKFTRFNQKTIVCYFVNDYIEIVNNTTGLDMITVSGLFANPLDVETVRTECAKQTDKCDCKECLEKSECIDSDGELVIEDELVPLVKEFIYKELGLREPETKTDIDVNK